MGLAGLAGLSGLSGIVPMAVAVVPPGGLDPDAATFIANVETADGQALEAAIRSAYNQFVIDCKADASPKAGVSNWAAFGAVVPMMGARTLAGALVPLKGPAPTNFGFVADDYNRITGLKGNSTSKYLSSNYNNNANLQNDKHLASFVTEIGTVGVLMGSGVVEPGVSQLFYRSNTRLARLNPSNLVESRPGTFVAGFVGASRDNASIVENRFPGQSLAESQGSTAPLDGPINIFARDVSSPAYSNDRRAFYSIGASVNLVSLDLRVTALHNAIAAALA